MREAVHQVLVSRALPLDGLSRAIKWSFGIHIGTLLLVIVVPRAWITTDRTPPRLMTIELGGTPGPRSTGQTAIGGRTVDEVAPPERRPPPVLPATARPNTMTIPDRESVQVKPPPPAPPRPSAPVTRPPARGAEVTRGNTAVETGARGQGAGLSFGGGGGTSGTLEVTDFCCPEYIELLRGKIDGEWRKVQPERGTTIVRFTIRRDGAIENVEIVQSSGSTLLDREATRALRSVQLPPLPTAYREPALRIRLTFPYETQ